MKTEQLDGCTSPACLAGPRAGEDDGAAALLRGQGWATKPVYAEEDVVAALTTMGGRYGSVAWNGNSVSYSIGTGRLAPGHSQWDPEYDGYAAMSPTMKRAAAEAFELWDDLVAISLVELPGNPMANITFNYSSETGNRTYAKHSYYLKGGRAEHTMADADLWFATGWSTHDEDGDLFMGGYGFLTYLHEIGHGLGLSHPGAYNFQATFAADATHFQDTRAYTVMSYFDAHENGSGTDHVGDAGRRFAATPMLNDIVAAQAIYGPDMATRKGATTYGFGSTAGRAAFDFEKNPDPVVAIWDAGGVDTIDVSGWNTDQVVSLAEGAFSSVGRLTQNLAIAWGAVIENAVGGGGDDLLIGNAARNELRGGAGGDTLVGGAGDDALWGGSGGDHLDGGAGSDRVRYSGASVAVDLGARAGAGGDAAGDTYAGIENAVGTNTDDLLVGDAGSNQLHGRGGGDLLRGRGGRDTLSGGDGADRLEGGGGDDRLLGDAGDDLLLGGAGRDHLHGGAGTDMASYRNAGAGVIVNLTTGAGTAGEALGDRLVSVEGLLGSAHADTLVGNGGANRLSGGDGKDVLTGLGGNDRLEGGAGADRLKGDSGSDWAIYTGSAGSVRADLAAGRGRGGEAEGDRYVGVENVAGSARGDVLTGSGVANQLKGGGGDDRLSGGGGNDTLVGGGGDDVLKGGVGADLLQGGAGADLFVFAARDGRDRIEGFAIGQDLIGIGAVTGFGQLAVSAWALGAQIGYGRGDAILIAGVGVDEITEDLFVFG